MRLESEKHVSYVILKVKDKDLYVFQHRDDIPNISSPNLFAGWGGAIEDGEDIHQAARRELEEETSLKANDLDIKYKGVVQVKVPKYGQRHVFYAEIDSPDFEVYEGQGSVKLSLNEIKELGSEAFTPSTAKGLDEFFLDNFWNNQD